MIRLPHPAVIYSQIGVQCFCQDNAYTLSLLRTCSIFSKNPLLHVFDDCWTQLIGSATFNRATQLKINDLVSQVWEVLASFWLRVKMLSNDRRRKCDFVCAFSRAFVNFCFPVFFSIRISSMASGCFGLVRCLYSEVKSKNGALVSGEK